MSAVSRRQFLRTSGTVMAATTLPSMALSSRAAAADKELIPRRLPFPPNDEFGNFEPTITSDGNTIYFARFANTGDKRVRGKGSDIFVTHRIRQSGEPRRPDPRRRFRPRPREVPPDGLRALRSGDKGMEGADRRPALQSAEHRRL